MSENGGPSSIDGVLNGVFDAAASVLAAPGPEPEIEETGRVERVGQGVAMIRGLPRVKADELLIFPGGASGMAFGLEPDRVDAVLLARADRVCAGMEARRSGRVIDVPVGEGLLGRVIDPLGGVLDEGPPLEPGPRYPIERDAPAIMDRAPVSVPLQTGILSVDALIPVGRGQRELILGDRQVGKTALALDAILNQRGKGVVCVYCSIGQQNSATAKVVAELRDRGAMSYTIVVAVGGDEGPGLNFLAPYAATSIGEFFMERGEDVLVVYDDLSRHARSYRELSLLLRRPPAREAYPGDIFYIHSRLLERATHLVPERGGGSLTALPIVETEGQNIAAYIPTNLVSITDGQIYLTPRLFQGGMLPPVDVGKSVSRVGGAAQLPAYRAVAGPLRLSYSQFEELEVFERFSTRLDEGTRAALERGHRIREALRQARYEPLEVSAQIAILLALTRGLFDPVPVSAMRAAMARIAAMMRGELAAVSRRIEGGELLTEEDETLMLATASAAIAPIGPRIRLMDSLEALGGRISGARSLRSIVRTMKILAAVGLRQFEKATRSLDRYDEAIALGLRVVLASYKEGEEAPLGGHPDGSGAGEGADVVVLGSDMGMCGQFNERVASFAAERLGRLGRVRIIAVGDRASRRLEDGGLRVEAAMPFPAGGAVGIEAAVSAILSRLDAWREETRPNRLLLYRNLPAGGGMEYGPAESVLLPVDGDWLDEQRRRPWRRRGIPIFTMDRDLLLHSLLRSCVHARLYRAFLESLSSENAARLASMQSAEKHIEEHLEELVSRFNAVRQEAITSELLDIIAGVEAQGGASA